MAAPETARAEAIANALNASTDLTSAIYQVLPDAAGLTRLSDGTYLEVNPAFCRLLGMRREEVIGRTSTELKVWASAAERARLIDALQHNGQVDDLPMVANGRDVAIPGRMFARRVQINGEECLVFVFHDTTQEQRTHTELLAVNTSLAQAGRMARLGAWEDVRGQGLVYWSDVCYDIHGLPPGSALPRRYIETYVAPPWQDAMRANFRQCIAEQTEWSMEIQIIRADGSLRWVRTRGEPVVENGRVVRIQGVMQDIDEYHRATERLHQSEERFSRMFQLAPYPMGMTRRDNATFIEVNPAWEAMFGFSREEALGRSTIDLGIYTAETRARMVEAANATDMLKGYEMLATTRSGSQLTLLQSMRGTQFDNQDVWLFALHDITDRKRAEEQVREREALLSLTLSAANLGLWDWNLHTGLITGDQRWRTMRGLPPDAPGAPWTDDLEPEDVLQVTTEVTRHTAEPGTPFDATICIRRPHEKDRWLRALGKVVRFDDSGQPMRMLGVSIDVTGQREQEILLRRLAHFDPLTGLPNRVLLARKLAEGMSLAHAEGSLLGVAYLDLDGFKPVNDRLGHDAGDRLLVIAAQRLTRALRPQDCVARLGGDEFVILMPGLSSNNECKHGLNQVMQSIAAPYQIGNHRVSVTASIGYTLYPSDDADADTLMRHADQAMYAAKQGGRNRFHEFDATQERQSRQLREQILELRDALAQGQFVLYLQPKVDMHLGTVVGAEALARWKHPDKGVLSPAAFMPLLEGTEIEVAFGAWVVDAGLRLVKMLMEHQFHLPISLNISAPHLQQPGFADWMAQKLADHPQVPPALVEIEITETAALYHVDHVANTLKVLQNIGLGTSLDDFGTGYSSLTYLRRLPLSTLKIDQSFVHGMMNDAGDLAIVQGVIGLARSFGYRIIAEGVETADQGQMLLQLGCHMAQGYHFARPMPVEDFIPWVKNWQAPALANRPHTG
ncbi:MAG: EAL domain-containing protein [Nitrospirota bacterium]|jgi:diguanylate cyclase (GGDEF)-like protein/PAS domain S-box-containing protein